MLKSIVIVTISVLNLAPVESAYRDHLQYQTVEQGQLSEAMTGAWNTPEMTGRDYLLIRPTGDEEVYLRFVENPATKDHVAMTTHGWNATELLVKDPDALAEQLDDSPFEIIGPPKDLWAAPDAPRAMQVLGPGDEVLYLTRNERFDYDEIIDRVFIMVLAGPSMNALQDYYRDTMKLVVGEATPFQITVVSRAQGLPPETTYPLGLATISADFLIELDEYPDSIGARPVPEGFLPPGTAMVAFFAEDLDAFEVQWLAAPQPIAAHPYNGRRAAVTVGPAGEWIEIIETD